MKFNVNYVHIFEDYHCDEIHFKSPEIGSETIFMDQICKYQSELQKELCQLIEKYLEVKENEKNN